MCKARGFKLPWDFNQYAAFALKGGTNYLRDAIYGALPGLKGQESNWDVLYREKTKFLLELLNQEPIPLMPGAEGLLRALELADIPRCVVTHSSRQQVSLIQQRQP